jgi:hypothetical protein
VRNHGAVVAKPPEHNVGIGLVDFLMMDTPSADSMETYPPWRITNIKDHKNLERDQKIGGLEKLHVLKTNQANAGQLGPEHTFSARWAGWAA